MLEKCFELNEDEMKSWDVDGAKAVLGRKCIALNAFIGKEGEWMREWVDEWMNEPRIWPLET